MLFLKPFLNQDVYVFLRGGGVLKGKLLTVAEDHVVLHGDAEKRGGGGEKVELDRYVSKAAIQWLEPAKGQRVD